MCQRYVLSEQTVAEREFMPATAWWKFTAKFNVSAEQYVPAIRVHEKQTEGVMLRWGFDPLLGGGRNYRSAANARQCWPPRGFEELPHGLD